MTARRVRWSLIMGLALLAGATRADRVSRADRPDIWVEVVTPHFTVMSNDGERTARRIAQQFEEIRILYSEALSPNLHVDPGIPIEIIAARNEHSLSQIIPEFWKQKGHTHPSGVFVPGSERNYIALRTDVQDEFPYLTIYHEYVHLIISLNYQHFPLWLNEGYATYLGSATLRPKSGLLGQANREELDVLKRSTLLPLETLFRVSIQSPYYNEEEKTNVFYAEAWALVHYLMSDAARQSDSQLTKYIRLVEDGDDPVASAKIAFGDLSELQNELEAYVARTNYKMAVVPLPDPVGTATFPARTVPPAEVSATLGEFDVTRSQLDKARTEIEGALRLDPNLAASQESMGFLLFREHKRSEAQKYFSRAVRLNSKSPLTYYYDGMILVSGDADEDDFDEAQSALEKAVSLRPELAPAWDALSILYQGDPQTRNKALGASENAVRAEPGEPRYRYNLAVVLFKSDRIDESRAIAQGIYKAGDPELASRARELLDEIARTTQREPAARYEADDVSRITAGRQDEARETPASSTAIPASHAYSMIGTITAAACGNAPQLNLTLEGAGITMHLHAVDVAKVEFKAQLGSADIRKNSCASLEGQTARVRYELAAQRPWDGEIVSVELQDTLQPIPESQ